MEDAHVISYNQSYSDEQDNIFIIPINNKLVILGGFTQKTTGTQIDRLKLQLFAKFMISVYSF